MEAKNPLTATKVVCCLLASVGVIAAVFIVLDHLPFGGADKVHDAFIDMAYALGLEEGRGDNTYLFFGILGAGAVCASLWILSSGFCLYALGKYETEDWTSGAAVLVSFVSVVAARVLIALVNSLYPLLLFGTGDETVYVVTLMFGPLLLFAAAYYTLCAAVKLAFHD